MADRAFKDDVKDFFKAVASMAGINRENVQGVHGAVHRQVREAEKLTEGTAPAASAPAPAQVEGVKYSLAKDMPPTAMQKAVDACKSMRVIGADGDPDIVKSNAAIAACKSNVMGGKGGK